MHHTHNAILKANHDVPLIYIVPIHLEDVHKHKKYGVLFDVEYTASINGLFTIQNYGDVIHSIIDVDDNPITKVKCRDKEYILPFYGFNQLDGLYQVESSKQAIYVTYFMPDSHTSNFYKTKFGEDTRNFLLSSDPGSEYRHKLALQMEEETKPTDEGATECNHIFALNPFIL